MKKFMEMTELDNMNDLHKPALDGIGFQELMTEQMAWWDVHITNGGFEGEGGCSTPAPAFAGVTNSVFRVKRENVRWATKPSLCEAEVTNSVFVVKWTRKNIFSRMDCRSMQLHREICLHGSRIIWARFCLRVSTGD